MNQNQLRLFVDRVLHDRYRIVNELGHGGMGAVYEAIDLHENNTHVAIKQMLPRDLDLREAFEREADILSRLCHSQLPHVSDRFEEETGLFMTMQFIPGYNLGQLLNSRPLPFPPHQVKAWAEDLLSTLDYLHARQPRVIHRDIKPTNLKLSANGRIVLLDFGLAREINDTDADNREPADFCLLAYTPHYAPPEQIQGRETDCYSDIYALGATLYHLLTGTPPIDALKRLNEKRTTSLDPLKPISKIIKGVPQALSMMIMQALALDPQHRPNSAADMLAHLKAGTIAPRFQTDLNTQATLVPKPSVLSHNQHHLKLARPSRINVPLPSHHAETPLPPRQGNVIAFSRFREHQEKHEGIRTALPRVANLASMILLLISIGSVARYVSRTPINPFIQQSSFNELYVSDDLQPPATPTTTRNAFLTRNIEYVSGTPPLPKTLTLDDYTRYRARYVKKTSNNRSLPYYTAQSTTDNPLF